LDVNERNFYEPTFKKLKYSRSFDAFFYPVKSAHINAFFESFGIRSNFV